LLHPGAEELSFLCDAFTPLTLTRGRDARRNEMEHFVGNNTNSLLRNYKVFTDRARSHG